MSETDLSRSIRAALVKAGFWVIRIQSGTAHRGRMKLAEAGTPDLYLPGFGHLEIKVPGAKPNAHQLEWHEKARRLGVRVATVDSIREALETAMRWRSELDHERAMGWR